MATLNAGKYVSVNGLKMYYEVHGAGKPLVVLHGAFGGIAMFEQLLQQLAETRQVIAVELQAHGHTADIDRPLSLESMADDVAALLKHLRFANADILGYSLGGSVALQTVIRHPDLVRKLMVVSAPCKSDGWYAERLTVMRSMNAEVAKTWIGSPMHQAYVSVAPNPGNWTTLATKIGQLLGQDYDWSKDVAAIKTPTMIVIGDADMHMRWSSSSCSVAEKRMLARMAQEYPMPDFLSCPQRRITTSCSLRCWHPQWRHSLTHLCQKRKNRDSEMIPSTRHSTPPNPAFERDAAKARRPSTLR